MRHNAAWNKGKITFAKAGAALARGFARVNGRGIVRGSMAGAVIGTVLCGLSTLVKFGVLDGRIIVVGAASGSVCALVGAVVGTFVMRARLEANPGGNADAATVLAAAVATLLVLIFMACVLLVLFAFTRSEPSIVAIQCISLFAGGILATT